MPKTDFRAFATRLDSHPMCRRETPPQLDSPELGSPRKVWTLLCVKDELFARDANLFAKHPKLEKRMREILLEWVMEVCADRRLHRETYHLAVDYLDRFLEKSVDVEPSKLQLLASTALLISSKVEEIYPPTVKEIAEHTDGYCNEDDLLNMEEVMLQTLEWNCAPVTSVHWLALYMQLMNVKEIGQEARKLRDTRVSRRRRTIDITPTPAQAHSTDSSFTFDSPTRNLDISSLSDDYHLFPDSRCTIPVLMRDEFVRLATVLDLIVLDAESLKFKYSELAAAVVLSYYQPEEFIYQITGFKASQLKAARAFVEPFVEVTEHTDPTGTTIPSFHDVDGGLVYPEDAHNIQLYMGKALAKLHSAQKVLESKRVKEAKVKLLSPASKSRVRTRKRKLH